MSNPQNPNHDIALQVQGLTRKFGQLTAVDNLTFDIFTNEIFGILGPNGAGKTTTINMICGILPMTSGEIRFRDVSGKDPRALIGYCSQENIYYPKLTCLEQITFMGLIYGLQMKEIKSRALELLKLLGLEDITHTYAGKLSGGMKRRLNICMALIHDPEILILDEPEAGLDPQSRILVRNFIREFGDRKTVILTTHNMDEADRLANRIAIIDYGKLLMLDTPFNLKRTVGEGDMLELVPENGPHDTISAFTEKAKTLSMNVKISDHSIFIKHHQLIEQLPVIKSLLEETGLKNVEIRLRENTLEDVFIHLTGRTLRP
jgi:ABC-2 type transport system ATP-binding protein